MKILITGICGFVGYSVAKQLRALSGDLKIVGIDNLIRPGSELNRANLKALDVDFYHGDIRNASDFDVLPAVDWVIDAAANPSVLAGVDGKTSGRQLMEHNLAGTIEILEYCRKHSAGFLLLSTSRVYGVEPLANIPVEPSGARFELNQAANPMVGLTKAGISEAFSTEPPLSLYGTSKRAAELLALEYGSAFDLPVWINRCGVLAGPGQFGKADQGIFSFWIHSHRARRPLKYIGFGGNGYQVRDFFSPDDLAHLIFQQIQNPDKQVPKILNLGGGRELSMSLAELTEWCDDRFGKHEVTHTEEIRPFDIPWVIMDSNKVLEYWGWHPSWSKEELLESIAQHAEANPNWLEVVT